MGDYSLFYYEKPCQSLARKVVSKPLARKAAHKATRKSTGGKAHRQSLGRKVVRKALAGVRIPIQTLFKMPKPYLVKKRRGIHTSSFARKGKRLPDSTGGNEDHQERETVIHVNFESFETAMAEEERVNQAMDLTMVEGMHFLVDIDRLRLFYV